MDEKPTQEEKERAKEPDLLSEAIASLKEDDANISRNAIAFTHVPHEGTTFPVQHPRGYVVISRQELAYLHDGIRREQGHYVQKLSAYEIESRNLSEVIARQQAELSRRKSLIKEMREEILITRKAIPSPFRWIVRILLGRAIALDEIERNREIARNVKLASDLDRELKGKVR